MQICRNYWICPHTYMTLSIWSIWTILTAAGLFWVNGCLQWYATNRVHNNQTSLDGGDGDDGQRPVSVIKCTHTLGESSFKGPGTLEIIQRMWMVHMMQFYSKLNQITDYSNKYLENLFCIIRVCHTFIGCHVICAPNSQWDGDF